MPICPRCRTNERHVTISGNVTGYCSGCAAAVEREAYQRMTAEQRLRSVNNGRIYGLTHDEYIERLSLPCEQCGASGPNTIDHDHVTGKVRGTLCSRHNRGLGCFHDNIDELKAAIVYLERYT